MAWWCGVALVLTLAACGPERPMEVDASADGAASADGGFPTPPAIPWLDVGAPPIAPPAIAPCPDGWREIVSPDDGTTCEPYPETGRADCPAGEAHFPGEPGCAPQVNIVFATNAKETAAAMVESEPRMFMPVAGHAGMDLGRVALEEFAQSEKPVRWWHVSLPVDARTGGAAIELDKNCGETFCPPTVNVAGPSRIHNGTRDDMVYVVVIVDATKLKGTTWQQLGDYLAVVSLCQIDPHTNPASFDSILNLFTNPKAYSGLTDWDRSYVKALYEFDQERIESMQTNEIVGRIAARELESAQ